MSRKPNIKFRKSDAEKLEETIRKFNAKIYRARYNHPEIKDILPDTIKKKDITSLTENFKDMPRNEFNKYVNSLERFLKKGAEKEIVSATGNRVTKWEKNEVSYKVAQINRDRAKERKIVENLEATSQGESLGMKRGEMGSERLNSLKPKTFNFDKIRGGAEWEKYKANINRLADKKAMDNRLEFYKRNYITAMENCYGTHASELIEIVQALPASVILETYYREQEASIEFHYDLQDMQVKLDILTDIWQGVTDNLNDYEIYR